MPLYECYVSFTYEADSPDEAAKMFLTNIPMATWYVGVRDTETGEQFTVDTDTSDV